MQNLRTKCIFLHIFSPIYFFTYFFSEIYSFLNVKLYLEVLSKSKIVFLLGDLENVLKHLHTKSRQKKTNGDKKRNCQCYKA